MKKINKVGRNIMCLANAINETVTSIALKLEISSGHMSDIKYSKKNPKRQTLEKFAKYFGVSVESLMNDDFTELNLLVDPARFARNIYTLLPLQVSSEALKNPGFAKAYAAQKRCYDAEKDLKPIRDREEQKKLCEDMMTYFDLGESEDVSKAAIINGISFYFYYLLCLKSVEIISRYYYHFEHYPAMIEKMKENNSDFKGMIESIENDDLPDGTPFQDVIHDDEFEETINEFLVDLKTVEGERDLAEYYLCLLYVFSAVNNCFSAEQNNEFGTEIMFRFAEMGNKYANDFVSKIILSDIKCGYII